MFNNYFYVIACRYPAKQLLLVGLSYTNQILLESGKIQIQIAQKTIPNGQYNNISYDMYNVNNDVYR